MRTVTLCTLACVLYTQWLCAYVHGNPVCCVYPVKRQLIANQSSSTGQFPESSAEKVVSDVRTSLYCTYAIWSLHQAYKSVPLQLRTCVDGFCVIDNMIAPIESVLILNYCWIKLLKD